MMYKIKPNDNLSKIAKKFNCTVELIMAFNPEIKNPNHIYVNQVIKIPNLEDVPGELTLIETSNVAHFMNRAKSAIGKGIRYKLGFGGIKPELNLPTSDKKCDCSGFICWIFKISRKTDSPFYQKFGGWIYTDSMEADIKSASGIFNKIETPEVGCIVVYGAGNKIGHVGIVSEVKNGKMTKVIHCSSGNDAKFKDAIQETAPTVFNRADIFWGRFTDIV